MNRLACNLLICVIFLTSCIFFAADISAQDNKWERVVSDAGALLEEVQKIPLQGIPEDLLNGCSAIAIFPRTTSAGFFIGGQYGSGIIMIRDQNSGNWSSPAIFDLAGGSSVGFQIGGENTDLIFLFMDGRILRDILSGSLKIGANMPVLAGPVGLKYSPDSDIRLKGVILSYYRSQEVFGGMGMSGAEITENLTANKALYGADLSSIDILAVKKVTMPKSAAAILKALKTSI